MVTPRDPAATLAGAATPLMSNAVAAMPTTSRLEPINDLLQIRGGRSVWRRIVTQIQRLRRRRLSVKRPPGAQRHRIPAVRIPKDPGRRGGEVRLRRDVGLDLGDGVIGERDALAEPVLF